VSGANVDESKLSGIFLFETVNSVLNDLQLPEIIITIKIKIT
jgi:hypothetical protein